MTNNKNHLTTVHFGIATPAPRPFLSMALCDGQHTLKTKRCVFQWEQVTCPTCLILGDEAADAILSLPDSALIALGAWHAHMSDPLYNRTAGQ